MTEVFCSASATVGYQFDHSVTGAGEPLAASPDLLEKEEVGVGAVGCCAQLPGWCRPVVWEMTAA